MKCLFFFPPNPPSPPPPTDSSTVVAQKLQPNPPEKKKKRLPAQSKRNGAPASAANGLSMDTPGRFKSPPFVPPSLWLHSYPKWRADFFFFFIVQIIVFGTCWVWEKTLGKRLKRKGRNGCNNNNKKLMCNIFSVLFFGFSALCSFLCAITRRCLFPPHTCNE